MQPSLLESPPSPPVGLVKPELLAPAGDLECVRAAIENGADAVYFGLSAHNARARATNFTSQELPQVIRLLHRQGVKGYVTLNTLVFPRELPEVEQLLRQIAAAGTDAVIVQDLAVLRLARALCPELPLHASTQMTMTSAESIRQVQQLGVERVILARELSLDEIRKIRTQTEMPLEVFVHGALCVAYSGQCLTSEALGGRSANRGQCAQACRLPYQVICDGQPVDLGSVSYLLSPQDLAAYALVPELVRLGLASLKIEGRLKTPEYVANITRHYRLAIDGAIAGQPVVFSRRQVEEMELSFSRGFSPGWLEGNNHKRLVPGQSSSKRGVFLGQVRQIRGNRLTVELAAPVKRGDGVALEAPRAEEPVQGGRVYELFCRQQPVAGPISTGLVEIAFGHGQVDLRQVSVGQRLWKTDDPELTRRLRQSFTGPEPHRKVELQLRVTARVGQHLEIQAQAANGASALVMSDEPLSPAVKHPLSVELLTEQLGRLGTTVYRLAQLDAQIEGGPMVPLSVLGSLRKQLVAALEASLANSPPRRLAEQSVLETLRSLLPKTHLPPAAAVQGQQSIAPQLRVLCRELAQVSAAIDCGVADLYVDFQDIRQYAAAVKLAHQSGCRIGLATPRIQKPSEGPLFRHLLRPGADGILVRNLAGLAFYAQRGLPVVADFSLNAANELSVQWLRERGADRITASFDLNREQLLDLVDAVPAEWLEIVVHQHMPMFHMEHCVFCAVLSPGTNRTNCGRPCDHHLVQLSDRVGMAHPLKADVGCRNTLFNAVPQSAAELVPHLLARGVRHFRVELLDHAPDQVSGMLNLYRRLLAGQISAREVWGTLRATNRVGVTRGPLET